MLQRQFVLYIYINLAAVFCISAHTQEFNGTLIKLLSAYTITLKANLLNSTCGKELQNFQDAVDQQVLWSLKGM